jgi:mannose-6-phosphate isomerase-like protein (cupin superfamily)
MTSNTGRKKQSRRAFFSNVTATSALAALAMTQMSLPTAAMAQAGKEPNEWLRGENIPPWPEGTTGNRYDHLFCTRMKERPLTDTILSPTISFRGDSDLPGAGINIGFRYYVKPFKMELQSHHHDVDEYLFFLGGQLPDLTANFDAEIEIFLGPEYERHIITKPCILYIPRGFEHNPMDIKRVGKPLLFMPLLLAPYFNGVYQTGYRQFLGNEKID